MPPSMISFTSDSVDGGYSYGTNATSTTTIEDSEFKLMRERVERLLEVEYPQLKGKSYLDHGGTTPYPKTTVESFAADLLATLYGNPHSESSPSALAGTKVDLIRDQTLRFFNADPEKWDIIFVANASAAIKLVTECFRDYASSVKKRFYYGYHKDAHTSLVGGRTLADKHHCFIDDDEVDQWIQNDGKFGKWTHRSVGLFGYPGQSNMTGRRLPLDWCSRIHGLSTKRSIYTILDAAALATTTALHLEDLQASPDMVAVSFYKIFGFPNLGALLVQKNCRHIFECRKYFGGGTVEMVTVVGDSWHAKKSGSLHDRLEDGTLPFHAIFALGHALETHELLYGPNPMSWISRWTATLVGMFYCQLNQLQHSNGQPMVHFHKDFDSTYGDPNTQGATMAISVLRADGSIVGYADVEKAADAADIYVRSGSLCNPGGMATFLNWSPDQMKKAYARGHRCSDPIQSVFGKATGVVRVSLGAMSTVGDIEAFVNFVSSTYRDTLLHQGEEEASTTHECENEMCLQTTAQGRSRKGRFGLRTRLSCFGM